MNNLQEIYYIVSIVFMVSILAIFICIAFWAYRIQKKFSDLKRIASNPADTAAEISAGIVDGISVKIQDIIRSNQKNKRRKIT